MMRPRSVVSHGDATIYNFMFGAVIVRDGVVLGVSSGINQAKEDLDTEVNRIELAPPPPIRLFSHDEDQS